MGHAGYDYQWEISWKWLIDPDNGLWFFWVLFWIFVIHLPLSKLIYKFKLQSEIVFSICCLFFLGILIISKLSFGFHLIAWYLPFYWIGFLISKHYSKIMPILDKFRLPLFIL